MITPEVEKIEAAVRQHFDIAFEKGSLYNLGIYNRRYIAGTTTWSQHSWGNAWDIGVKAGPGRVTLGNQVEAYLRAEDLARRLPVGTILWQVADHYDHLHVEGQPKRTGTPPIEPEEEEMTLKIGATGASVSLYQKAYNAWGGSEPDLVVDGRYGEGTAAAIKKYQAAADLPQTGEIDGVTAANLIRFAVNPGDHDHTAQVTSTVKLT